MCERDTYKRHPTEKCAVREGTHTRDILLRNVMCERGYIYTRSVRRITVLGHFHKNDLMPVISCLTSLTFFVIISCYIYPIFSKSFFWHFIFKEITVCVLVWSDR